MLARPFKKSACAHLEMLKESSWEEINASVYYLCHIKLFYQGIIKRSKAVCPIRCQQCSQFNTIHVNLTLPRYFCLKCITKQTVLTADLYVSVDHFEVYCTTCADYVFDDEIYYLKRYFDTFLLKNELPGKSQSRFVVERPWLENEQLLVTKYSKPAKCTGLRGILNLGNTCYLNVIVQSLIFNPLLQDYFLKGKHEFHSLEDNNQTDQDNLTELKHMYDFCFACDLDELIRDTFNPSLQKPLCPTNLLYHSWLSFKDLSGYSQQDSHEYLMHLLNSLHDTFTNNQMFDKCPCIIHKAFGSVLESTVTCTNCNVQSEKFDSALDINLDIKLTSTKGSLSSCLDRYFSEEILHHFTCTKCYLKKDAKRSMRFKVLPNILAIQLKRFEVSNNVANPRQKIDTPIYFPVNLDMSPYSKDYNCWYELNAVVLHKGKLDSGHYSMYTKHNERWFHFDDHKVECVSIEDVLNTKAYLLFYSRKVIE